MIVRSGPFFAPPVRSHPTTSAAWGDFLGKRDWAHFVTLTCKREIPPHLLRTYFEKFIRPLERAAQRAVPWFMATEHTHEAHWHIHALLAGTEALHIDFIRRMWPHGYTNVRLYDPALAASFYVSKRLLELEDHYDISPHRPPLLRQ